MFKENVDLITSVQNNNTEDVLKILSLGENKDINFEGYYGETLLYTAVTNRNFDICKALSILAYH